MSSVRSILFIGLAFVFVKIEGDDDDDYSFNLENALKGDPTLAPVTKPALPDVPLDFDDGKKPVKPKEDDSGGFDLNDALEGVDKYTPTEAPYKPGGSGGSGHQFRDEDLANAAGDNYKPDKTSSKGRSGGAAEGSNQESSQGNNTGTLTGIISGVLLTVVGTVSSYILYQKKKLCFKLTGSSGEQNVKQNSAQGQQDEPQSYNSLLQSHPANNP
ncbi:CD99 antigen-like protein 2 [Hypanus sabinus]|uniref:CD99 antigen-like protein 2 n=1 Tax=Hypanus sabinus TaxID=79690 RepID=UPI0028C46997|nr:CD99 antigen-like protein 2 [Hypanus sabinus]